MGGEKTEYRMVGVDGIVSYPRDDRSTAEETARRWDKVFPDAAPHKVQFRTITEWKDVPSV